MFIFFEIEAPQRVADTRLAEAEEKKKAKVEPSGAAGGLGEEEAQDRRWGGYRRSVPSLSMMSS